MVSEVLADALSAPTDALFDVISSNHGAEDIPQVVASHFTSVFATEDAFRQVSSATSSIALQANFTAQVPQQVNEHHFWFYPALDTTPGCIPSAAHVCEQGKTNCAVSSHGPRHITISRTLPVFRCQFSQWWMGTRRKPWKWFDRIGRLPELRQASWTYCNLGSKRPRGGLMVFRLFGWSGYQF